MSKPLREVIDRIELLGHTLAVCEKEFNFLSKLNEFDVRRFRFDQLPAALVSVDVSTISPDYGEGGEDFGPDERVLGCNKISNRHVHDTLESE